MTLQRPAALALALSAGAVLGGTWRGGAASAPSVPRADCSRTSVGLTALPDLGGNPWEGHAGGLYPGGLNEPPAGHAALAARASSSILPLDPAGEPSPDGRVVLLSLGMSNTTQEFQEFQRQAAATSGLSERLLIVDGAQGGQTAAAIRDPSARFWTVVDERLAAAGATAAQVQALWLKEANAGPQGPAAAHAEDLSDDLAEIARVVKARFANAAVMYVSSRIYGGYASTGLNPEPYAYASGFAVKWLIERQIEGREDLNPDPGAGPVRAPVMLWGPYLWADGTAGRADGLTWACEEFVADGTHPSPAGRYKVGALLLNFFIADPYARGWFLAEGASPAPVPTAGMPGAPVPLRRSFRLRETPSGDAFWVTTADATAQRRLAMVSPAQPAWACAPVLVDAGREWGFVLDERRLSVERSVPPAAQTTVRAIAADPEAAAGQGVRCLRFDQVLASQDGEAPGVATPTGTAAAGDTPSPPAPTASATSQDPGPDEAAIFLPSLRAGSR